MQTLIIPICLQYSDIQFGTAEERTSMPNPALGSTRQALSVMAMAVEVNVQNYNVTRALSKAPTNRAELSPNQKD